MPPLWPSIGNGRSSNVAMPVPYPLRRPARAAIARSRLFHVAEILGIDDESVADLTPAEQHLDEASKLARRAVQVARRPQIDSRVADGGTGGARVSACQRAFIGRRQREAARRHFERLEDLSADVVLVRLVRELFNEIAGDCVARIRIRHPRAGAPPHSTRSRVDREHVRQRTIGLTFRDVALVEAACRRSRPCAAAGG